jgi:hypothetical protein
MRNIIAEMTKTYLIGSSHQKGYFIIRNEADFNEAIADLKSKGKSIFERANNLFKLFHGDKKQLTFNF